MDAAVAGEGEVSLWHFDERHDSRGFPSSVMSGEPVAAGFHGSSVPCLVDRVHTLSKLLGVLSK